jgi:micrococcal nuclease
MKLTWRPSTRRERHILRMPGRWLLWALVCALIALGIADRAGLFGWQGDDYARYHGKTFRVAKVVDGDTIDLAVSDGHRPYTRVRLWGVDTPEVGRDGRQQMYFGPEASAFTREAVLNRSVRIELSQERSRDKYGRLLAFVYLPDGDDTLNERLIATGHGYADSRFRHEFKDRFRAAEERAARAKAGLWEGVTFDQFPEWRKRMERWKQERDR